jgi:hypothetical protein
VRWTRSILGLLLVYQAFFLNVLLPGHTRGAITVDGKHTPAACCCCGGKPAGGDPAVPSQRDRDHCALCQFAGVLTPDPVVQLVIAELGLLDVLPTPAPAVAESRDLVTTYLACGPPLSPAHV